MGVYWTLGNGQTADAKGGLLVNRVRKSVVLVVVTASAAITALSVASAGAAVPAVPLQFEAVRSYLGHVSSHFPDVGDFNNDGRPELISTLQNADGTFTTFDQDAIGLGAVDAQPVVDPAKTFRVADFNGDGFDDILQEPYGACVSDRRYAARIFINDGRGRFVEDPAFTKISRLRGRGETVLAADFNNDGKIDIFFPFYNRPDDPNACSNVPNPDPFIPTDRMFRNDSSGGVMKFTDVTASAGTLHPPNEVDAGGQVIGPAEGAQAADVNGDGLIDMLVGQRLYLNRGNFHFEDYTTTAGLPAPRWANFEEGAKFIDWNNDGRLDIVSDSQRGGGSSNNGQTLGVIRLYEQSATCASGAAVCFTERTTSADGAPLFSEVTDGSKKTVPTCDAFGLWGKDINNDGYEDIIISGTADVSRPQCGSSSHDWLVFLNMQATGGGFILSSSQVSFRDLQPNGSLGANNVFGGPLHVSFADFDRDGRPDIAVYGAPNGGNTSRAIGFNRSPEIGTSFSVIVRDAAGHNSQQGRVVRATKLDGPGQPTITQAVDGGSGYLTNGEYPLMFGTTDTSRYRVDVKLPNAANPTQLVTVSATAVSGQVITITQPDAAHPGGQVDVINRDGSHATTNTRTAPAYRGTAPVRLLDTRPTSLTGYTGEKPVAGQVIEVNAGQAPSPAVNPAAAALNITATDANGGFVTVWPCDQPRPTTSNLNTVPGLTAANLVITKLSPSGTACIYTDQGTHLIADLQGYFPQGSSYVSLQPERLLDTRPGSLTGYAGDKPTTDQRVKLQVAGVGAANVPIDNSGVVLNVTGTEADGGYVTVWPCDNPLPTASNLNLSPGSTRPNLVVVKTAADGSVCLYTSQPSHLLADLVGYFPAGSEFTSIQPTRVLDTRATSPIGSTGTKLFAGQTIRANVTGLGLAPNNISQAVVNVTATDAEGGFLTVYPCGQPVPTASNLNVIPDDTRPNLAIATVIGGDVCIFTDHPTNLIVDLSGWFNAA